MPAVTLNYLAIIVGAVILQAVGFFWYSDTGFGKPWRALMGINDAKAKAMKDGGGMGKTMTTASIAGLIMVFILAYAVAYSQATTLISGAITGFWIWLGFIATTMLNSVLFEQKPTKLYYINIGYYLVSLLIIGGLLAVW